MEALTGAASSAMTPGNPAARIFQLQWQTYRKMVDNNYLFHREAYAALRRVLADEVAAPFRFLDIACGDASATVSALRGTRVASFHGIDLSSAALQIASENVAVLECPCELHEADFAEALLRWEDPVDVAWIGLSLHHFRTAEKLELMRTVRRIVGKGGRLLLYENSSPDGEIRDQWLARWDGQRPHWTEFTEDEWEAMAAHVHGHDFPETVATWRRLGSEAGFAQTRELFVTPTDLFRLYCFEA
jgi:SAM-dependent methyltransferase